jgi:hypothetical protein
MSMMPIQIDIEKQRWYKALGYTTTYLLAQASSSESLTVKIKAHLNTLNVFTSKLSGASG